MNELVERVNKLLKDGEPGNITKADTNGYVGYEPQAIIDSMNESFGLGNWGFEELSSETVDNEKGTLAVAQVRVWLKDIDFKPFAWGQSRVTRGDTGDAKKGAQTDAIKKALAYFSIGNRAYHGLLEKPEKSVGNVGNKQTGQQQQPTSRVVDSAPVQEQANGHQEQAVPSVKELQDRCNKLFGVGYWQAMVQKVLKVPEDALIRESDLTPEDRLNVKKYMDYVESTKKASAGAGR